MPTIQLANKRRVKCCIALRHAFMITCSATFERPKCQKRCGGTSKRYSRPIQPHENFNSDKSWTTSNKGICQQLHLEDQGDVRLPRIDQCQHWWRWNGADMPQRPSTVIRCHKVGNVCKGESSILLRSPVDVARRRKPCLNEEQCARRTHALFKLGWRKGTK